MGDLLRAWGVFACVVLGVGCGPQSAAVSAEVSGARQSAIGSPARDPQAAVSFLRAFNAKLHLPASLVQQREQDLAKDLNGFFEGTPALFYRDLDGAFAPLAALTAADPRVSSIDGDPHLGNFGTYRALDGSAVWGLNDFDQAGAGSLAWDLERYAADLVLKARGLGLTSEQEVELVHGFIAAYAQELKALEKTPVTGAALTQAEAQGQVAKSIADAHALSRLDFLSKLATDPTGGSPRLILDATHLALDATARSELVAAMNGYAASLPAAAPVARPLRALDAVKKLGGGSTFGLERYELLVASATPSALPYLIEVKQCLPAPFEDPTTNLPAVDARRVVQHEEALGARTNSLTGVLQLHGLSMLVREHEPEKGGVKLGKVDSAAKLTELVGQAARALARAHAWKQGPAGVEAWLTGNEVAVTTRLTDFAQAYATQAQADFVAFQARPATL